MKRNIKKYLVFTAGERNGTIVLALLLMVAIIVPHLHEWVNKREGYSPDPQWIKMVNEFFQERQDDTLIALNSSGVILTHPTVELNSADTSDLMQIRGFGPVLSRRILRYRGILGGYYSLCQLMEVYGIDQERFEYTVPYIRVDTSLVTKISVSSAEFGVLLRHPYLTYEQVSEIFRMRNRSENLSGKDLYDSGFFSEKEIKRLMFYLCFE